MKRIITLFVTALVAVVVLTACSMSEVTEEDRDLMVGTWRTAPEVGGVICIQLNEDGTMATSGYPANLLVGGGLTNTDLSDVEPETVQWDNPIAFSGTWRVGTGTSPWLYGDGQSKEDVQYAFSLTVSRVQSRDFRVAQWVGHLDDYNPIYFKRSAGSCEQ